MKVRLFAAVVAVLALPVLAEDDPALRHEKRLSELERQIELLRRDNAMLKRRLEILGLPAREAMEAYLDEKGLTGVPMRDREGDPLERILRALRIWGGLEVRYEGRKNTVDFDSTTEDDGDFIFNRLELGLGFDFNENVTFDTELRAAFLGGGVGGLNEPGVLHLEDMDSVYVHQAYLLFRDINLLGRFGGHIPVTIQAGRQEMSYGEGFILGSDEFGRGISYDGVRFIQAQESHRLDLFWAKLTENDFLYDTGVIAPTTTPDEDADIIGLYFSCYPIQDTSIDGYVIYLTSRGGTAPAPYGGYPEASVVTIGGRFAGTARAGAAGLVKYALEGTFQEGSYLGDNVEGAFALSGRARYDAVGRTANPFVQALAFFSTGDAMAADGEMNRFMPLAQERHDLAGGMDLFISSNLSAIGGRVGITPLGEVALFAGYFSYYADETADTAGALVPGGGTGEHVGWEWNLGLGWDINSQSRLECLYGEFTPGAFTPVTDAARRLYLSLQLAF